jgi:hypothetical protein
MMFVKTIIALSLAILAVAVPQPQGTSIFHLIPCSCTSLTEINVADNLIGNLEADVNVVGDRIGNAFAPPPADGAA